MAVISISDGLTFRSKEWTGSQFQEPALIRHIVFFTASEPGNVDAIVEGLQLRGTIPHSSRGGDDLIINQ